MGWGREKRAEKGNMKGTAGEVIDVRKKEVERGRYFLGGRIAKAC